MAAEKVKSGRARVLLVPLEDTNDAGSECTHFALVNYLQASSSLFRLVLSFL